MRNVTKVTGYAHAREPQIKRSDAAGDYHERAHGLRKRAVRWRALGHAHRLEHSKTAVRTGPEDRMMAAWTRRRSLIVHRQVHARGRGDARAALALMTARLPTAPSLVYDNYNALVIGFAPSEKACDAFSRSRLSAMGQVVLPQGVDCRTPTPARRQRSRVRSVRLIPSAARSSGGLRADRCARSPTRRQSTRKRRGHADHQVDFG